ncbi:hypothetical protein G6F35_015970 [Rhizopus arrhizus]|nr:hypothetical protein G6F35_015970 [Rhizopus arrhizus]
MSAHDLGVTANIGAAGDIAGDGVQIGQASGRFGAALHLQRVVNGQNVGRLAAVHQARSGFENQPVVVTVEVFGAQQVAKAIPGAIVLQQTAQDALLRIDRMRRHTQGFGGHAASLCACKRWAWTPWVVSEYVPLAASAYQSR